jgi:hypothetical protein
MIHFPSKAARDYYERSLMREEITRMRFETAKLRVELRAERRASQLIAKRKARSRARARW